MNAAETIKMSLNATQFLLNEYLADLSDEDFLQRPVPEANHIAWQLGHLITSEVALVKGDIPDAAYPDMPAGFAEKHTKDTSKTDAPGSFHSKQEYLDLFNKVRAVTVATVEKLSDADLDKATVGPMKQFAPRVADLLILVSNHTLMHGGQFTVVRRKLNKKVLF